MHNKKINLTLCEKDMTDINYLRIFLYGLFYIENLETYKVLNLENIKSEYEPDEIEGIVKALSWAKENPKHDFHSMLPIIKFENSQIYSYLMQVYEQLKNYNKY